MRTLKTDYNMNDRGSITGSGCYFPCRCFVRWNPTVFLRTGTQRTIITEIVSVTL